MFVYEGFSETGVQPLTVSSKCLIFLLSVREVFLLGLFNFVCRPSTAKTNPVSEWSPTSDNTFSTVSESKLCYHENIRRTFYAISWLRRRGGRDPWNEIGLELACNRG